MEPEAKLLLQEISHRIKAVEKATEKKFDELRADLKEFNKTNENTKEELYRQIEALAIRAENLEKADIRMSSRVKILETKEKSDDTEKKYKLSVVFAICSLIIALGSIIRGFFA